MEMKIKLSPQVANETTNAPVITVSGLTLTIDDQVIDLSVIPEGGQAEADEDSPLIGIVTRDEVTIRYSYSTDIYECNQPTESSAYKFEIVEGQVPCPLIKRPVAENEVIENV
jgi:hypothetical protein